MGVRGKTVIGSSGDTSSGRKLTDIRSNGLFEKQNKILGTYVKKNICINNGSIGPTYTYHKYVPIKDATEFVSLQSVSGVGKNK